MNESIKKYFNIIKNFWVSQTKRQKQIYIGSVVLLALVIGIISFLTTRTTYVPLYSNLSLSEVGSIKTDLDSKNIKYQITDGGTTIEVPGNVVDSLKVELASEGLPKTGSIDYSFFSQNAGLGTTDNEFNVLKLAAMQTELENLIKGIDGVQDAKVMISLPNNGVFVSDNTQSASASIVLDVKPGYTFSDAQIKGLYQLVSKSVPNLPTSNIVIMDQNFQYYNLNNSDTGTSGDSGTTSFAAQDSIRKQVARDIQQQVQTMLGTLMGADKVVVNVSTDIDFTQENDVENLYTPVDQANMKGIVVSAENIKQTFTGTGNVAGGTPTTGSTTDTTGSSYVSGTNSNGNSQYTDDKVNYDVNNIRKQIVQSPYKIRDIGIQVAVEPPTPNNPNSLPASTVTDIKSILGTIISTSIDKSSGPALTNQAINNKIVVSVHPFNGKTNFANQASSSIPWWVYAIGGVLLAGFITVLILFLRSRRQADEEDMADMPQTEKVYVPDVNEEKESESTLRRKQLEKMAKEHPEDFAKLLRTWISED